MTWCLAAAPNALAQDAAPVVEAAVEAVAEVAAAPEAEVDENKAAYEELLAAQGDNAYAFDFFTTSMLWTVIAAAMVFIMHLGFATLETGLTQSKNTVNILFKNVFIICIGLLTYAVIGFNTHYPGDFNGWFSLGGPLGEGNVDDTFGYGGVALCMTGYGDFIFQAMFAATAATIVSGAVAERVKLLPFLIFATLLVGIAYPVVGSWHWGGGWMGSLSGGNGFKDFAGSAVVHAFGGFAALACVIVLGPRAGKYIEGKVRPIPGHNMALATIGTLLLWFGWFGFNGGSVLSAAPGPVGLVFVTTALAAAAGGLTSIITSWVLLKKPDLSMALNGILAGLVGITANADIVSPLPGSLIIGGVAGVLVVLAVLFFDKIKIDDPVGAISVHGVCGVWGILACALFDTTDSGYTLVGQLIGVGAVGIAAFVFSIVVFGILKVTTGVRVSAEEESEGLDLGEHGQEAYPDFQSNTKG
ncbi:MAG: ammonium transporter [Blastochloris sp.]|nr:ammonium transporter [Blastochloris sp.]